jgi:hypothetical protein
VKLIEVLTAATFIFSQKVAIKRKTPVIVEDFFHISEMEEFFILSIDPYFVYWKEIISVCPRDSIPMDLNDETTSKIALLSKLLQYIAYIMLFIIKSIFLKYCFSIVIS